MKVAFEQEERIVVRIPEMERVEGEWRERIWKA